MIRIMSEKLYEAIHLRKSVDTEELISQKLFETPKELFLNLQELEKDKRIARHKGICYDLSALDDAEGYVQFGINGFCWLSDMDSSNEFGISFDTSFELLPILNKKDVPLGSKAKCKKIILTDDSEIAVAVSTEPHKNVKLIAVYGEPYGKWRILNSGIPQSFKTKKVAGAKHGDVAVFESFELAQIEKIGNMADKGIESLIVASLGGVSEAAPSEFEAYVEATPIRSEAFCTIDSLNTKDIDDAVFAQKTENGFLLSVAIADVSSFVPIGSPSDARGSESCTSFYFPHKTFHMLDRRLAETSCSLNPGELKSALICDMEFDLNGAMSSFEFSQGRIFSSARLTYDDVDRIFAGDDPIESSFASSSSNPDPKKSASDIVRILKELSDERRKSQLDDPFWRAKSVEFVLGENGKVEFIKEEEESPDSQKIVETAMLAANMAAAMRLHAAYPEFSMFRNQLAPDEGEFPKPAFYDRSNSGHWGLKADFYTHFTSPIRRYCDLIVHRMLKSAAAGSDNPYSPEELDSISERINLQQFKAKQFEIRTRNMLLAQYLENVHKSGDLQEKFKIIDYSENGISCRNKQNIDFFIPSFKLDEALAERVSLIIESDPLPDKAAKAEIIKSLNSDWLIYAKLNSYEWTDDRKNAYYSFVKKAKKTAKP